MAYGHYEGSWHARSGFSSWAASLHLVLGYASSMHSECDAHVAVMDTRSIEEEVLVWHCMTFLGKGSHEYLAYGPIRGRGYCAVSVKELREHGLHRLFPTLKAEPFNYVFTTTTSASYFLDRRTSVSSTDLELAARIATLFPGVFLPVFVALLTLQIRPCFDKDKPFRIL